MRHLQKVMIPYCHQVIYAYLSLFPTFDIPYHQYGLYAPSYQIQTLRDANSHHLNAYGVTLQPKTTCPCVSFALIAHFSQVQMPISRKILHELPLFIA